MVGLKFRPCPWNSARPNGGEDRQRARPPSGWDQDDTDGEKEVGVCLLRMEETGKEYSLGFGFNFLKNGWD